ncbi:MAG TPA: hypothetical protein VFI84_00665 [Candidatus Saccharimonadales bacterium]|nr:hypothetical protein [Candidatus Saccharimonadales bacterium]
MTYLPLNEQAAGYHEQALDAVRHGQFEQAHDLYTLALSELGLDDADAANQTQAGMIMRDHGVAYVKDALLTTSPYVKAMLFENAESRLIAAARITLPYADGLEQPFVGEITNFLSKRQRREVISEHAATIGRLGELVLRRQVALGEITKAVTASPTQRAQQFQIAAAYDRAKTGSNQYIAARIARTGMLAERINGNRALNILPWLGRLTMTIGRAALRDRSNVRLAARELFEVPGNMFTRESALGVATDWKTV